MLEDIELERMRRWCLVCSSGLRTYTDTTPLIRIYGPRARTASAPVSIKQTIRATYEARAALLALIHDDLAAVEMQKLHLLAEFFGRHFGHRRKERAELLLVHEPLVQHLHVCTRSRRSQGNTFDSSTINSTSQQVGERDIIL
jgi:hypothetical protein